jgi:hypothetical protein
MTLAVDDGAVVVAQGTPEILDFPNWMVWLIQLAVTGLAVFALVSLMVMLGVALHMLLDKDDAQTYHRKHPEVNTFFDQEAHKR